jgi:error-prone DNA polymerase
VHLVAQQLIDLTGDLSGLADRDTNFRLPTGRGDEFAHGRRGANSRERAPVNARDIYVRDLHIDTLKVKARNFHQLASDGVGRAPVELRISDSIKLCHVEDG